MAQIGFEFYKPRLRGMNLYFIFTPKQSISGEVITKENGTNNRSSHICLQDNNTMGTHDQDHQAEPVQGRIPTY